jgi:DNA-binding response OmpR family regulator
MSHLKHIVLLCDDNNSKKEIIKQLTRIKNIDLSTAQTIQQLHKQINARVPDMILVHFSNRAISSLRGDLRIDSIPVCRIPDNANGLEEVMNLISSMQEHY